MSEFKCPNCNANLEISQDNTMLVCPFCKHKELIPESDAVKIEKIKVQTEKDVLNEKFKQNQEIQKQKDTKDKLNAFKKGVFSKILIIYFAIAVLLCALAFSNGKILAAVAAIVMCALSLISWLMGMQIIKEKFNGLHIIIGIISFLCFIPFFMFMNSNTPVDKSEQIVWSEDIELHNMLPEPRSRKATVISNTQNYLSIDIHKTTKEDYKSYIALCEQQGYIVEAEKSTNSYKAYNNDGYNVRISFYESDEEMHIVLEKPKLYDTFSWPKGEFPGLIPVPESNVGKIEKNDEKSFLAHIGNTSHEMFAKYVESCFKAGFNYDVKNSENYFYAKNDIGHSLTIEYQGNNIIFISIYESEYKIDFEINCVENLLFSKYDITINIADKYEYTLAHGSTETYSVVLTKGNYTVKFSSAENPKLTSETNINITKNESFKYKVSCHSDGVKFESINALAENTEFQKSTITITVSEEELKGLSLTTAESLLKEMGFSIFEYNTLETDTNPELDGKIGAVEIKSWLFGKGEFSKGDVYESDAKVVLWIYKYTKPEESPNVYYSNQNYDSAKKGNSGIFSYKSNGKEYDIYWIVSFEEGFAYWFAEGNGDTTCDKIPIVAGNLNSSTTVTWNFDGEYISWYLHFKYENHPETLILTDHNGFKNEFEPTDLEKALALKNTKKINSYI